MINRNRFLNIKQFVIDPDREYGNLCNALHGSLIKFGTDQVINVFDIRNTLIDEDESYLRNKVSKLNTFFTLIFNDMNDEEKALLEEKIIKCYELKGITEDNNSLFESNEKSKILKMKKFKDSSKMPRIEDLYELLKKDKKLKKYAVVLKPYVTRKFKIS